MRSKQLSNEKLTRLTDTQVRYIEKLYRDVWETRGTIGGPKIWFDVIVTFLEREGYEIKRKEE